MADKAFECKGCGAVLRFSPGTQKLKCEYCGTENIINQENTRIEELDYQSFLGKAVAESGLETVRLVKCPACAAEINFQNNKTADLCPFCETSLVLTNTIEKQLIKPRSLLTFKIEQSEARQHFQQWIKSLWFAPGKLKKYARLQEGLKGLYVPYWTYDSKTYNSYSGQRGTYYYVTERYTTTDSSGKTVTKTRQVRKTRWRSVSGNTRVNFDDVLVMASNSLPESYARELEPWDLNNLVPYKDEYLSGFRAETYQIGLKEGFAKAQEIMKNKINESIRRDIGGDEQRINHVNTSYSDITFKHLLLPVWITSYNYRNKIYRILVNARTGEVQGERPWSKIKLALLAILLLIIIAAFIYFYQSR